MSASIADPARSTGTPEQSESDPLPSPVESLGLVIAVLRRPSLWTEALRALRRLARPRWWRRWPPLPLPTPEYLRFRSITSSGTGRLTSTELVDYLKWCRHSRDTLG